MVSDMLNVEVAYALPYDQRIIPVSIPTGSTVADAIEASAICRIFPEIDLSISKIGIFSKVTQLDTILRDRDRVEIYRPLIADPKEVRKQRAASGKQMKKGGAEST